jgi:hypothetical protein
LEDVRRVGRHTESDGVVLLAAELEVGRVVALVAIQDQEAINTYCTGLGVLVEMLVPFWTSFVRRPSVLRGGNDPILRQRAVLVPRQPFA